jgi:hypothetical protein
VVEKHTGFLFRAKKKVSFSEVEALMKETFNL